MEGVFLAMTNGIVASATSTALINPMTGLNATIPVGACIRNIFVYHDNVVPDCRILLGTVNNASKFINIEDNFTTTLLNTSSTLNKIMVTSAGNVSGDELRIVLDNELTDGIIYFRISYMTL